MQTNKRRKTSSPTAARATTTTTSTTTTITRKLLLVSCIFGLLLFGIQIELVASAPASDDGNINAADLDADAIKTTTIAIDIETTTTTIPNDVQLNSSTTTTTTTTEPSAITTIAVDAATSEPNIITTTATTTDIEQNVNDADSSTTSVTASSELLGTPTTAATDTTTTTTTTTTESALNKLDAETTISPSSPSSSSSTSTSTFVVGALPVTSIEPITTTEPTTTPKVLTDADEQNATHIQHIPLKDLHIHSAHDAVIGGDVITTEHELLINQITNDNEDVLKDLNNFRHPATLITASNSEESLREADEDSGDNEARSKPHEFVQMSQHYEEDPYHAHILSKNHDRLAEHEDYQMLSSTEDAIDAERSTTTTTTTTTEAPPNTVFVDEAKIVVSAENKATAVPSLLLDDSTSTTTTTTEPTTTTTAATVFAVDAVRARAMNINDSIDVDEDDNNTATTTPATPVVNIIEGQHLQKNSTATATNTTTTACTTSPNGGIECPEVMLVSSIEGRSNSAIEAESEFLNKSNETQTEQQDETTERQENHLDLSDVSMDDERESSMTTTTTTTTTTTPKTIEEQEMPEMPKIIEITAADAVHRECLDEGKSYKTGESMSRGCDENCTCNRGEWICEARCKGQSYARGSQRSMANPQCHEEPAVEDAECCRIMVCEQTQHVESVELAGAPELSNGVVADNASTPKPRNDCHYMGGTYKFRERLEIGCEQICHCDESGEMNCRPRCPERNHTRIDKCVYVKDPKDVCCQLEFCDVKFDDHEQQSIHNALNGSDDQQHQQQQQPQLLYAGLEEQARDAGSTIAAETPGSCEFKGEIYHEGQQFRDGCEQLCICNAQGVHCAKLECPSNFGLDVLNPHCLRWEPEPADFKPIPPNCCPESMRCVDNGTCIYRNEMFDNWAPIPTNLTGCEQHCFCEHGKVECRPACPPVLALPPADLPCHPAQARLMPIPDDECSACKHWTCAPLTPKLSGNSDGDDEDDNNNNTQSSSTQDSSAEFTPSHVTTTTTTTMTNNNHNNVVPASKPIDYEKKPISNNNSNSNNNNNNNAFYPTLDGKPPKSQSGIFGDYKPEKHEKPTKKPTLHKPQQNDVKYDVHEQHDDDLAPPPVPGFIPIHLGVGGNAHIPPYDYNHNLAQQQHQQHQQQQQHPHHLGPYGFFNPANNPKDHYDPYNPYEPYDINPNGIPQGKPPAPTSQSDLFNILGAGPPGIIANGVGGVHKPIAGNPNLSPNVRIEHILQHLQPQPNAVSQGPFVGQSPLNGSGVQQQQQQHDFSHPHYVPIVHTGVPPPPPPHSIAIVDGQPIAGYESYPILPGLGGQPQTPHHHHQQQQQQQLQQLQQQQHQQQTTSTSSSRPPIIGPGLTAQATEHSLHQKPAGSQQAGFDNLQADIEVHALEAIDPRTIRIVFTVPQVYVNLHGRVELRYTNGPDNDTAHWEQQIFAPPEDLIATSQMEFDLPGLEPNSLYKVKITLILRDVNSQPTSSVYTVKMPAEREITPPPQISDYRPDFQDVFKNVEDPELNVSETNSTWLQLTWKKLSDEQLEYVDGVQLRYKELTGMIYSSTPLVHRTLTTYTIENLQPDTGYEIGLYYIPFPGHGAELRAGHMIKVRTAPKVDVYAFDVTVNVTKVKAQSVEVSWSGVPYPEDKYVNIYRAIYQSDAGKEDSSVFKVAKRDSTTGTLIMDLKPGTKYRLWLEMYLTNGNIKKSNVVNFVTKPGGPATPGKTGKLLTAGIDQPVGDYYGPLVVVSVVAALAIMSTIVLLLIITRRRVHQTASITPPRKSDAAYDNPSYKVEIQQETMNL